MTTIKLAAAAGLACLSLAFAISSNAQMHGIGRGGGGPGASSHMGSFRGAETATRAILAGLHTRLAITADQESAWQAFANATIAEAAHMDGQMAQAPITVNNAVDAFNFRASVMRRQADDATAVAQAFAALYPVLTPAQRAILDDYFAHGPMM